MKNLLMALSLLMITQPVSAGVGFHAALNVGNASLTPPTSTDSVSGIILGAHILRNLRGNFSLEPGLQFAQRGFGLTVTGFATTYTYSYLEIPVLTRWRFSPNRVFSPFLIAGPNVGFNVGSSCSFAGLNMSNLPCTERSASSINLALELGTGADIPLDRGQTITISLRYFGGLNNVNQSSAASARLTGLEFLGEFNLP